MKNKLILLMLLILPILCFSQKRYYYCYYLEEPSSAKYSLDKNFRPIACYTIVKSVNKNCIDNVYDTGLKNVFYDYLKGKYGNELPYGNHYSRTFNSRKEAEESRLKSLADLRKYHNYKLTEFQYFNYYCD